MILIGVSLPMLPAGTSAQTPPEAKPAPSTRTSLTGKALYDFNCASCHGKDLSGNGPVAQALKTAPTNLTTLAKNNGGKFPRKEVRDYIAGTRALAAHGTRQMPVWGPSLKWYDYQPYGLYIAELSETERGRRIEAIIDYIASKQAK